MRWTHKTKEELVTEIRHLKKELRVLEVNERGNGTRLSVAEELQKTVENLNLVGIVIEEDGVIIMVTPDHNSFQRKLFRKNWFQYKPIEHIQYFTKDTLNTFAGRNGLQMTWHIRSGQYADTDFIVNRLRYYRFSFLYRIFDKIFSVLQLKNRFFYIDTGSLLVAFKKKP